MNFSVDVRFRVQVTKNLEIFGFFNLKGYFGVPENRKNPIRNTWGIHWTDGFVLLDDTES